MKENLRFRVNGKPISLEVDPGRKLLWVLRYDLKLTGSKYGCGEAFCGACTVIIDRQVARSCSVEMKDVAGKEIITIEGLEQSGKLHPLQEAFVKHDALQCGYCTPGMIMNAYGLLLSNPRPTRSQIIEQMEGNLCRCGAHVRIVAAIETAARQMGGSAR
jgi:aerobic-type carbon monoxide dehydrogenase small subunit (CoxS/CutS family)